MGTELAGSLLMRKELASSLLMRKELASSLLAGLRLLANRDRAAPMTGRRLQSSAAPRADSGPAAVTSSASNPTDSAPQREVDPELERHVRQRLATASGTRLYTFLTEGDPLGLEVVCGRRVRERYVLVDAERLVRAGAATTVIRARTLGPDTPLAVWVSAVVDDALDELLREDRELRRSGWAPGPQGDPRYDFLLWAFAIEPHRSLGALVAFNGLAARVRRAFFAFVLDGQGVEQCLTLGLGPREQLQRDLRAGVDALLHHGRPL